jgi:hypothetical protein
METVYIFLWTWFGVECYIFPEIYNAHKVCLTCALNHKHNKKNLGAKLYSWDKKDSLQKAPDFISHALTFKEL